MRLGAVDFGFSTPFTLILLGVLWAAMMAVFIFIGRANVSIGADAEPVSATQEDKRTEIRVQSEGMKR